MKKLVLLIVLCIVFVLINNRASLYYRGLLPCIGSPLPFGFTVDYYEAKYHIRDVEGCYAIVFAECSFPTGSPLPNKEKIYIDEVNGVHWTSDRIIVDVLSGKEKRLIEIKDYVTESYFKDYDFVTEKELEEMEDHVIFREQPIFLGFWPIIGSFYLIGLIYILFSKKVSRLLGE